MLVYKIIISGIPLGDLINNDFPFPSITLFIPCVYFDFADIQRDLDLYSAGFPTKLLSSKDCRRLCNFFNRYTQNDYHFTFFKSIFYYEKKKKKFKKNSSHSCK